MSEMKPTPKLRFVDRVDYVQRWGDTDMEHTALILQQWWVVAGTLPEYHDQYGEWRDVPIEKEQK